MIARYLKLPFYDLSSPEHYAVLALATVDLISDALPFGGLWYGEANATANAIGYAMHRSRSHRSDCAITLRPKSFSAAHIAL